MNANDLFDEWLCGDKEQACEGLLQAKRSVLISFILIAYDVLDPESAEILACDLQQMLTDREG